MDYLKLHFQIRLGPVPQARMKSLFVINFIDKFWQINNYISHLKDNIFPIDNALEKILQLNGVSFNWKAGGKADLGVIAQGVEGITHLNLLFMSENETSRKNLKSCLQDLKFSINFPRARDLKSLRPFFRFI